MILCLDSEFLPEIIRKHDHVRLRPRNGSRVVESPYSYSDLEFDSEVENEVNAEILHSNIVPKVAPATVMHWLKQLDHNQRWSKNKEFYDRGVRKDDKLIPRLPM